MLPLIGENQMLRLTLTCIALVLFLGCGLNGSKKLAVSNLTVANQDSTQDVTKDDATLNLNTLEAFELSLSATGSGFPAGQSICEIQIFKQSNEEGNAKTRCNLEREGNQIKIFQRLLTPEQPMEGELRISHNGQRILTRRVKVVKKADK